MAKLGGQFKVLDALLTKGDPRDPNTNRIYDCLVWGVVSSRAPQEVIREKADSQHIEFGVTWRRHSFVNCRVYPGNPFAYDIVRKLRPGDPVAVLGKLQEFSYKPKRGKRQGKDVIVRRLEVNLVFPARLIAGLMEQMQEDAAPDILEGLDAYLAESEHDGGSDTIPW